MNNEFEGGRSFECPCSIQPGGCPASLGGDACRISGEVILKTQGIRDKSFAFNIGILALMVGGYRIILVLYLKFQEMRRKQSGPKQSGNAKAATSYAK